MFGAYNIIQILNFIKLQNINHKGIYLRFRIINMVLSKKSYLLNRVNLILLRFSIIAVYGIHMIL